MEPDVDAEIEALSAAMALVIDEFLTEILETAEASPEIPLAIPDDRIEEVLEVARESNDGAREVVLERMQDLVDGDASDDDAQDLQGGFDLAISFFVVKTITEAVARIHGASVARQIMDGDRQDEIDSAVDISKNRAEFVANAEVRTSTAQFSEATSLENGFSYYRYHTAEDEVVRADHVSRNGKVFAYGRARVADDVPGMAPRCRCFDFPLTDQEVLELDTSDFFYPEDAPALDIAASGEPVDDLMKRQKILLKGLNLAIRADGDSIDVSGYIDFWDDNDFVSLKRKINERLDGSPDAVLRFNITSHGGDAFDGMAIYSYLVNLSNRVETEIYGYAGSAATLIVAASDHATIGASDAFLIHNTNACACGDADDLKSVANSMESLNEGAVTAYVRKTGKSETEVRELMARDEYISATDALEFGLVDAIRADTPISANAREKFTQLTGKQYAAGASGANFNSNEDSPMTQEEIDALKAERDAAIERADQAEGQVATLDADLKVEQSAKAAAEARIKELDGVDRETIRAEVRAEIEAEKASFDAARERITKAGFEAKGESVIELYTNALTDAHAPTDGLDEVGLVAVFASVEKYRGDLGGEDLGISFRADGDESNTTQGMSRRERHAKSAGGTN